MQKPLKNHPTLAEQPLTKKLRIHRFISGKKVILSSLAFLTLAGALYGVYSWQHNQVEDLSSRLDTSKHEVQKLQTSNTKLKASAEAAAKVAASETSKSMTNSIAASSSVQKNVVQTDLFPCGKPLTNSNGGPLPDHTATNQVEFISGYWTPRNIDIKVGTTVTWALDVTFHSSSTKMAVASDSGSCEDFNSPDLTTGSRYTHTFNQVGVFGWHDKYNGTIVGNTISVSE